MSASGHTPGTRGCYHYALTRIRFDRMFRAGQSAFLREKGCRTIDTYPQSQPRRLELVGEYDLTQKQELGALFGALPPDGPATIDLSRVTYVDTTFLHELVKLRSRLIPHRITLVVRSDNVRRLLNLVKFDLLFDIRAI